MTGLLPEELTSKLTYIVELSPCEVHVALIRLKQFNGTMIHTITDC